MPASPRPYRTAPAVQTSVEGPVEFVYAVGHPADENASMRVFFPALVVGALACAALARYGQLEAGIILLVAIAGGAWWRARRRMSGVVLRVRGGTMLIYPWRGAKKPAVITLDDLYDVRLDTKVIHRAQRETRPGVFAPGGYSGSLAVDVARITLVCAPTVSPIELTRAYASHSEVVERIAKMKTFLRARGWLPKDERGDSEEDAAP
jgi:hypothetical protein